LSKFSPKINKSYIIRVSLTNTRQKLPVPIKISKCQTYPCHVYLNKKFVEVGFVSGGC